MKSRFAAMSRRVAFLLAIGFPISAYAATKINQVLTNITQVLRTVVTIVFTLAVIAFGWAIVKLIAAAGNPEGIKNAKSLIFWSVIGMAVLASIAGLIAYIQAFFLIDPGSTTITVPQF
jgi:hypothetical protein